jgi:hypothetical protein
LQAEEKWETGPTVEWLAEHCRKIDEVRSALSWAFSESGDVSIGVELTVAAIPLWMQISLMDESRRWIERALEVGRTLPDFSPRDEMKLCAGLGTALLHARGPVPEANAIWNRALEIAETPIVIAHVASKTSTIRVGSGGIMLPNHPPLIVAEQFGTLASLYPGRIDLGLGRASGGTPGDEALFRALRLSPEARERFPSDVLELQSYFRAPQQGQLVVAVPGAGIDSPIWLLGSSDFSAMQAGVAGLPFVFATQIGHKELENAVIVRASCRRRRKSAHIC